MNNKKQTLVERILDDDNISDAIKYLQSKGDKEGPDGIKPSMLGEYWNDNKNSIVESIYNYKYEMGVVRQYTEVSKKGKKRIVSVLGVADKMISRAIVQIVAPEIEPQFIDSSFAYRKGLGCKDVAEFAKSQIINGRFYVAETDIQDFFDCIPHDALFNMIDAVFSEREVSILIKNMIACEVDLEEEKKKLDIGILQGMPISPLLSNIFLNDIDNEMKQLFEGYCRYGDDIRIFTRTAEEAEKALSVVVEKITNVKLQIKKNKSVIFKAVERPYFGYELIQKSGEILLQRIIKNNNKEIYHLWKSSAIREVDHNYHIVNGGILTKKDFTILFENTDEKKYIPIETIDSINIYSNVIFSSNFFELANKEHFAVNLISNTGNLVGRFIPDSWNRDSHVEKEQLRILNSPKEHLKLAIILQYANIFNIRASLRYYDRRKDDGIIDKSIEDITVILNKVKEAKSIDSLFMYEARARQIYFHCFNQVMPAESFEFIKRTRRPPKDAINAMISFGNTLLYTRFANAIYRSALDIRFGIIHNSDKRHESLNLDLADLFKPVLVDRTIFTLVNKNMINEVGDFEETESGGVYLSPKGKRIFLREFQRKLDTEVKYKSDIKKYSDLINIEVKKLESYFRSGAKYRPFKYVN